MNIDDLANPSVKIVFIGDSGVGKSSIICQYDKGEVPKDILPTIGAAYLSKIYSKNDIEIELRMWDTAGQETYQSLAPIYFLHSKIGFVVFDITQRSTFENITKWVSQLREFAGSDVIIVIVANKLDLEEKRQVKKEEYTKLASDLNTLVAETSAVNGDGVTNMVNQAMDALISSNNDMKYELSLRKKKNEQRGLGDRQMCC
ncbi:Ras-related protein RABH1b [Tritrichomonas foetus]|uniref:Ras-related protein RABH1b n=1 Tax=Tritrichomonas foetus TaxID=1144522 RepID=A0A1J4K0G0_9EUKA|nr:Ras-related protein RABH1b [Tritrichomonas foetus]|eukprot:OHT04434.1 Ras-related protein RABH1b [Tritrichomonas foetus]